MHDLTTLTAEQLADTQAGIGGSSAAAAAGVSKWKTPLVLWQEITGRKERDDLSENQRVEAGIRLEPVIRDWARDRLGIRIRQYHKATKRHPDYPFLLCHPDGKIEGKNEGFEAKNADLRTTFSADSQWGEDGTDHVPVEYMVQCQHSMLVTGWDAMHLAALIGGNDLRIFYIKRSEVLLEKLKARLLEFWSHVEKDTPPDAMTTADLRILYPEDDGRAIPLTTETGNLIAERSTLYLRKKEIDARLKDIDFQLQSALCAATSIADANGKPLVTWKTGETMRVDTGRLKKEDKETYNRFLKITTTRRMNYK